MILLKLLLIVLIFTNVSYLVATISLEGFSFFNFKSKLQIIKENLKDIYYTNQDGGLFYSTYSNNPSLNTQITLFIKKSESFLIIQKPKELLKYYSISMYTNHPIHMVFGFIDYYLNKKMIDKAEKLLSNCQHVDVLLQKGEKFDI